MYIGDINAIRKGRTRVKKCFEIRAPVIKFYYVMKNIKNDQRNPK